MNLYSHPRCSTCKKAEKFLKDQGLSFTYIDLTLTPPTEADLRHALQALGSLRKLFNTSGMRYRELGLKEKLDKMSEEEALSLLASDGMLVKRPLLLSEETALAGFREKNWSELF